MTCLKTKHDMFDPARSSTYRNITCLHKECKLVDDMKSQNTPPNFCARYPTSGCPYGLTYGGATTTEGVVATETIMLTSKQGKTLTLKDVVFGCGHLQTDPAGVATDGNEAAVVGLGLGPLSLVSQIAPYVGGNSLSHCLVPLDTDPKIESKITFGDGSEVTGQGVVSTPLIKSSTYPTKYNYIVQTQEITIGKEFIPFTIGKEKFDMIVDSCSTYTMVREDIFDRVAAEMKKALDPKFETFISQHADSNGRTLCLNSTAIPKEPNLTFHFEGGGKVELATEKMFIKDESCENKLCFGIMYEYQTEITLKGIIGAVMQGNMLVGFDMDKKVVSFKPTDCLNY